MTEINRTFTPKEIRGLLGMTLEELAKELNMSHMTLQRREKGLSDWKACEILKLSELSAIPQDRIVF